MPALGAGSMRPRSLISVAKITIVLILIAVIAFIVYIRQGELVDEKLAGTICAKVINDYISEDFIITKVQFNESYKFNQVKVDLFVRFNNGRETSMFCYYKKRYVNSTVSLIKADLRDQDSRLKTFNNLEVVYKK
jgi:hypothetical protein